MALKRISDNQDKPKEPKKFAEDTAMKPLVRQYMKQFPESVGKGFSIIGGRLTTNGWFLLETKEFVLLLPGGCKVAKNLFETIFPSLHGKEKKQLQVVPDKSDKYGGYLAIEDTLKTIYSWDSEDYILHVGKQPMSKEGKKELSPEDFD